MIEIERKFLVKNGLFKKEASCQYRIVQGFLSKHPERTVRVRIKNEKGFITVKGKSNQTGTSRFEWEKDIPFEEAEALLQICEPGRIDKIRYEVVVGQHTFEIDEFLGKNDGLVLAEIELKKENETYLKPHWLGEEVTGDVRYYNSQLSLNPFTAW